MPSIVPAFYQSRSYFANLLRRSNDLARRLIVLMRRDNSVLINHGQVKRGADYEPNDVSTASAMLEASSFVACTRTIIATPVVDRTLANLPPKFGHRGNHRANRSGKAGRWY